MCLSRQSKQSAQQVKWCVFSRQSRLLLQQVKWCVFVWEEQAVGAAD